MKSNFKILVAALAFGATVSPAMADNNDFDNRDLKGQYLCTITEVHQLMNSTTEHCVIAVTGNFDGAGVLVLNGTMRCSITGKAPLAGTQYYSVNPDGSLLISEAPSMADPVHGQIVDHGHSLLLDGTTRTLPEILSWSGVCMKR